MDRAIWTSALVGFLAPVALFSPFNSAGAWVSSFLKQARNQVAVERPPVNVTISPPAAGQRSMKPRVGLARHPAARPLDPREVAAGVIDPVARPDWYLIDPTIRRGDILFLKNRVVVFNGRKVGDPSDYVEVRNTRMLSRKERGMLEAMGPRSTPQSPAARRSRPGQNVAQQSEPKRRSASVY